MDSQSKKRFGWGFPLGLVIVLAGIAAILFWKAHISKPAATTKAVPKETAEPKKEEPREPAKVVLRSVLADRKWYPADARALSRQVEGFFQKAQVEAIDNVIALILPHAGYRYSGQTAVYALKTTQKKYKRIIVIGPSHNPYLAMEEVLSVPRVTHYETPLGQIPLDVEFIDKLLKYPMFQNVPQAHQSEHSVQIELPLLQYRQKDFELVPIVAGRCSPETVGKAAAILRSLAGKETLVIASSDFVHYGSRFGYVPFKENIPEQIKKLDMGAYEHIARLDSRGFQEYKQRTGATICGSIPIAILLSMFDELVESHLVKYTTSGELTGDFTNSVSYLSAAFSGAWGNCSQIEPKASNPGLTEEDKKQLLILARKSIAYALEHRRVPQAAKLGVEINDATSCPRAAFVTLKKIRESQMANRKSQNTNEDDRLAKSDMQYALRGCIGDIFPQRPLYKSVIINAINAGVNDRRFPPVTKEECNDITIEISALTVPEPISSPDEIRIGIDGVVLNKDGKSAVFLPHVAPEQGWDVNQMLTRLSLKAQLPADAWKEGANFLVFQAVVFGEEER